MMFDAAKCWRLIDTGPMPGSMNMAIDEALLRSFDPDVSLPVIRLYGWSPACLSLGRFQKTDKVLDLERCRADAVPMVRRITGGGVIWHADELTYAIICSPGQIPAAVSVKDSFRILTGFLLEFYARLGLKAGYAVDCLADQHRLGYRTDFCFAGRESFDVVIDGRKIGGNAQRRLKNVIFQHGSIPLINRSADGLGYMRDKSPSNAAGTVSLAELGIGCSREQLCDYLAGAFGDVFGVRLRREGMSVDEQALADALDVKKYLADAWNLEGLESGVSEKAGLAA